MAAPASGAGLTGFGLSLTIASVVAGVDRSSTKTLMGAAISQQFALPPRPNTVNVKLECGRISRGSSITELGVPIEVISTV